MAFEKTYTVQKDNRLVIDLPEQFRTKKQVRVIIEEVDESRAKKLLQIKEAAKDPLFLADLKEIGEDFKN